MSHAKKEKDESEEFEVMGMTALRISGRDKQNEIWDGMTLAAWALAKPRVLDYLAKSIREIVNEEPLNDESAQRISVAHFCVSAVVFLAFITYASLCFHKRSPHHHVPALAGHDSTYDSSEGLTVRHVSAVHDTTKFGRLVNPVFKSGAIDE